MLRAFPFRTFDEIAELGLEVSVYCSSCYRERGPIDLTDARLRGKPFAGARFVRSSIRRNGSAMPPRACGTLGQLQLSTYRLGTRSGPSRAYAWLARPADRH